MLAALHEVTKQFKDHRATDSLTLELRMGSAVGLLGVNGAGKTTCLKMLLGLLRPTSGSVSVFGVDAFADGPKVRQQVGYVPEDPWLYPWMTVRQVVDFASAIAQVDERLDDSQNVVLTQDAHRVGGVEIEAHVHLDAADGRKIVALVEIGRAHV